MERAGRTATLGKTGGVGTSWTERLQARSATQQINAVPKGRHYGALRGIPAEGVTENADRRLQAGEGVPLLALIKGVIPCKKAAPKGAACRHLRVSA